jgi:hypothetical protein
VTEQLDVFVELHETVADELYGIGLAGEEVIEAVGAGGGLTATVTEEEISSPLTALTQVKVKVVLE